MRAFVLAIAAAGGLFVSTASAADRCDATAVSVEGARVTISYDPFDNKDAVAPVVLLTQGECSQPAGLRVSPGTGAAGQSARLVVGRDVDIDFVDEMGRPIPTGFPAQSRQAAAPSIAAGGLRRLPLNTLNARVAARQPVRPGVYESDAVVMLTSEDGAMTTARFTVELRVAPSVRLGADKRTVDFGELEEGEVQGVDLAAYANANYDIRLMSDNGWRLTRDGRRAPGGVSYVARIDGRAATGNGESAAIMPLPQPSSNDMISLLNLDFEITDLGDEPPGVYQDWVTVVISARP